MANGDDAVAAGMSAVPSTADRRLGYDEINKTRDYIAQRTSTVQPVAKGGTGATTPAAARTNLGLGTAATADGTWADIAGTVVQRGTDGRFLIPDPTSGKHAATKDYADATASTAASSAAGGRVDWGSFNAVRAGNLAAAVYNRTLGGAYRVCYVNTDGTLGWVSSSRRHKKNIEAASVDVDAVLAMRLVTFLYKVEVDTGRLGELQHGLIAEDLDDLGLDWLVDYGTDGSPEGVRYDRLALALLPVIQRQEARLTAIEAHLDALGGLDA